MNNKLLISGVLGLGTCMIYTPIHAGEAQAQSKPNVLIIYTDDMGAGDVSFLNNGWVKTPNIDKLASGGLIVTNYYSSSPVSSPSRVGLTTGRFPTEMGINCYLQTRKGNAACEQFDYLDASVPTMAKVMKSAGYTTGHFGKWHMGGGRDVIDAPQITEYGFDEYISTWESPNPDPVITDSAWIWSRTDQVKRWDRTAYFVDKTLDFLKRHKGEPCFVNLWPDDMHTPWVPSQKTMDSERTSWTTPPNFKEVLTEYDKQIGRLMEGLTKLGLEKNTIVIFTTDHGEYLGEHGLMEKNNLYESVYHIPMVMTLPGMSVKSRNCKTWLNVIDFGRTLAGLVDIPYLYETDGLDRSRQILNNETSLEELYIHPSDVPRAGILTPDYELAYVGMGHCGEKFHDHVLFDCKKDPLQVNNLFNNPDYRKIQEELTEKIRVHHRMMKTPKKFLPEEVW